MQQAQDDAGPRAKANRVAEGRYRDILRLWAEGYARSLVEPDGLRADFAQTTVSDWLELLATAQAPDQRSSPPAITERTLTLAVLRGALLDLLATNDQQRTTAAVQHYLDP